MALSTVDELLFLDLLNAEGKDPGADDIVAADITATTPATYAEGDARGDDEVSTTVTVDGYRDSVEVRYFRPNLATLFNGINVTFPFGGATTKDAIVALLNQYYGLTYDASHFVDNTVVAGSPNTFSLEANAGNFYVTGSVTLTDGDVPTIQPDITDLVTLSTLSGFYYPDGIASVDFAGHTSAQFITYPLDFSDVEADINGYTTSSDLDADSTFADLLTGYTGVTWVVSEDTPADYNIANAIVMYNGVTSAAVSTIDDDRVPVVRTEFDNVLVIDLSEADQADGGVVGQIYLHYNDPV